MPTQPPWYTLHLTLGGRPLAVPLPAPEVQADELRSVAAVETASAQLQATLQTLYDRLSGPEQQLLAALLEQAPQTAGVVDGAASLTAVFNAQGLVLHDAAGSVYRIPRALLAQCRVSTPAGAAPGTALPPAPVVPADTHWLDTLGIPR